MSLLSGLALVLLTLVGYSSGSVQGAKGRAVIPNILDLLVIIALWIAALASRDIFSRWTNIAIWVVVGFILGMILARVRANSYAKVQTTQTGTGIWAAWKRFAQRMGNYQSRVLLAFLYYSVVLPFGLGLTIIGDPLGIKRVAKNSNWQPKDVPIRPSLEDARRQ